MEAAPVIYLDTHVVAWLHAAPAMLSDAAAAAIRRAETLRISPMVRLELQYLFEIGRVTQPASAVVDVLQARIQLVICPANFSAVVHEAERHGWTRDPFDRLIVAQAGLHDAPLLTKDAGIRAHYPLAVW